MSGSKAEASTRGAEGACGGGTPGRGGANVLSWPAPAGRAAPDGRREELVRAVEAEVIPRLVLARAAAAGAAPAPAPAPAEGGALGPADVAGLTESAMSPDPGAAAAFVVALAARGVPADALLLDLLTPAARHLGELWEADLATFGEVTLGLVRLQAALRELRPPPARAPDPRERGRRALLAPAPGEQHTFGLSIVGEFLAHGGWEVRTQPAGPDRDLARAVRGEWYAVVGFSVGRDNGLEALASTIRAVRRASRNRAVGVLVGGPVFVARPELVALVGADATAADGRQAASQAQRLMELRAGSA